MLEKRLIEWWLSWNTTFFGLFLVGPASSMSGVPYTLLTRWMPEACWGAFFLSAGVAHLGALWLNGRYWWTPMIRAAAAALNTAVFIFYGVGFMIMDPETTAVFVYLFLMPNAAAVCFYRAMVDVSLTFRGFSVSD